jgi:hypothetical protein
MLKSGKSNNSNKSTSGRKPTSRFSGKSLVGMLLVVTFAAAAFYIGYVVLRITRTVSQSTELAENVIRLQVVDACGREKMLMDVTRYLSNLSDGQVEVMVVDTVCMEERKVAATVIISRDGDESIAVLLAKRLGLDPSVVIVKPLENNYRQVSVTLVLGTDFDQSKLTMNSEKES